MLDILPYILYADPFKARFTLSATDQWNTKDRHFNYEDFHVQCVDYLEGEADTEEVELSD